MVRQALNKILIEILAIWEKNGTKKEDCSKQMAGEDTELQVPKENIKK